MIRKVVKRMALGDVDARRRDLEYWLSRPPAERIDAVDFLRSQVHGTEARLRGVLVSFNDHGVEYLIVGGYALAYHGAPRFTGDLDLLVEATAENAERILTALAAFGFGDLGLTVKDFTTPDRVVQFGVPPVRVDLLTSISGVTWEEAFADRVAGTYGDLPVYFIGRESFIANKRASGRARDLADLEDLGERS